MHWVPLIVWIAALVVAVVVLGYCAYEIAWKTKRLQRDLGDLQTDAAQLDAVRRGLATAAERVTAATTR